MKENKLWFRRKKYGWGWTPASWEGWVVILVYVLLFVWAFRSVDLVQNSGSDVLLNFAPRFIVLSVVLIIFCRVKGEKPKWCWGSTK